MKRKFCLLMLALGLPLSGFAENFINYEMVFSLRHEAAFDGINLVSPKEIHARVAVSSDRGFCQIKLDSGNVLQCRYTYDIFGSCMAAKTFTIDEAGGFKSLLSELHMSNDDLALVANDAVAIRYFHHGEKTLGFGTSAVSLKGVKDRVYTLEARVADRNYCNVY